MLNKESNPIKVLYCASDNYASSGAFLSMVKLCSLLQKKYNIKIHIILPSKGDGTSLLKKNGLKYTIIRSEDWIIPNDIKFLKLIKKLKKQLKNIIAFFKIYKIINEENIDIVHLNTVYTYTAAFAALAAKKPLIWHVKEIIPVSHKNKFLFPEKICSAMINKANKIITVSNETCNGYKYLDKNKIINIYEGIEEEVFYMPHHEILNNDNISFICTGEIYKQKGQEDLIKALVLLKKSNITNWELRILGRGEDKKLAKLIQQFGLENQIKLIGYRPDVSNYLMSSDIAFIPSHQEAFGRVVVESMLAGCLVIASKVGGIPEIIKDRETGLLHNPSNINEIYSKIKWAIANRNQCIQIAKQGQKRAIEKFTANNNADLIHKIYKELEEIN